VSQIFPRPVCYQIRNADRSGLWTSWRVSESDDVIFLINYDIDLHVDDEVTVPPATPVSSSSAASSSDGISAGAGVVQAVSAVSVHHKGNRASFSTA
jgi:hypothetical protein